MNKTLVIVTKFFLIYFIFSFCFFTPQSHAETSSICSNNSNMTYATMQCGSDETSTSPPACIATCANTSQSNIPYIPALTSVNCKFIPGSGIISTQQYSPNVNWSRCEPIANKDPKISPRTITCQ